MGRTSDSRKRLIQAGHDLIWGSSYGSVTIEAICERANVQKGTFYHFFDSKADLTIATINNWWDARKELVAQLFAPTVPPLQRLITCMDFVAQQEIASYHQHGRILGDPMFTLASEICTQDEQIRASLRKILDLGPLYFGNAIRDAQALGEVPPGDPVRLARILFSFYQGTLTRARIDNDPELLRTFSADAMALLGAKPAFVSLDAVLQNHVAA